MTFLRTPAEQSDSFQQKSLLKSPKNPVGLLLDTREDYEKFPEKPHACLTDLQYTDEVATGVIH